MKYCKIWDIDQEELTKIVNESENFHELCKKLGYSNTSGSMKEVIKNILIERNINYDHFTPSKSNKKFHVYTDEELFSKNSPYSNNTMLKERFIRLNLKEYKCEFCGNCGEWNGKKLILQLDHIDGDHSNNEVSNLRFLCPNCHSQTKTYAGKNAVYNETG